MILTCVVVEVVNPTNNRVGQEKARRGEPNYRLGTANGYMEMPVSRPYITALQNTTVEGMGLAGVMDMYKEGTLPKMSQQALAKAASPTGGQGMVH